MGFTGQDGDNSGHFGELESSRRKAPILSIGIAADRGNAIRDLAALNKVEMLPWDEWGPMKASYEGTTGPEFDELIDDLADVCASEDPTRIQDLYDTLRVPDEMIS